MTKQETKRAILRAFGDAARAIETAKREHGRTFAFAVAGTARRATYAEWPGVSRRKRIYSASLRDAFGAAFGA